MLLYQHYITMTIYKIILWKSAKDDLIQSGFWFESLEFLDLSQREGIYWALNGLFWGGVHCWWLLFMILSQWLSIQRNKTGQWIYHFHVWMSSLYAFWNKETCQQHTALVATWPPRSIQPRQDLTKGPPNYRRSKQPPMWSNRKVNWAKEVPSLRLSYLLSPKCVT